MFIKLHKKNNDGSIHPFLVNVKKIKHIDTNRDNITCVHLYKSWLFCIESIEQIEQMIKNVK